jgi:excisionase family DNA binding protein
VSIVLVNMTVQQATQHFNVSEKTIRRWIKSGKIKAELVDGKYHVQTDGHNDRTDDQTPLIERLQSEVEYLRERLVNRDQEIDHLTQLLAVSHKSIGALTEQLDASRLMIDDMRNRPSGWRRLFRWT